MHIGSLLLNLLNKSFANTALPSTKRFGRGHVYTTTIPKVKFKGSEKYLN